MLPFAIRATTAALVLAALAACSRPDAAKPLAAAKAHLEKKALPAAVIELKNALQVQPDLREARLLLGKTLLDLDDPVGAAVELAKARDPQEPGDDVVPLLARAYLLSGESRKVVELDRTAKLVERETIADLKATVAQAHGVLGSLPRAEAALAVALKAMPDHPAALLLQARLTALRGDVPQALRIVDGVLARNPADGEALRSRGELLQRSGDIDGALAQFRKAAEANAGDVAAHVAVMNLLLRGRDTEGAAKQLAALKQVRPNHLQTLLYDARIAVARADRKTAEERIQALLKRAPDNPDVLYLAGALALNQGDLRMAEHHLSRLVAAAPNSADARNMLARVYLRSGEPERLLATLQPLLEADSPSAETLSLAGSATLLTGDAKVAESYLSRATKLRPDDPSSKTALALSHIAQGDAERGIAELDRLAETGQQLGADMALIGALVNRRAYDQALKAVDRLGRKQAEAALPWQLRGQILRLKGDAAGARAAFEKALQADAKYFAAAEALASMDMRDGKADAAKARLEAFLKTDARPARTHLALATVEDHMGRPASEVVARLNKAVAADPTDLLARRRLVQFHGSRGDPTAALAAAKEAASALPNDPVILGLLAASQSMAGERNQAIGAYSRLATLRPKAPEPLLALAEAHLANKDLPAAQEAAKRALQLAPGLLTAHRVAAVIDLRAGRKQQALDRARALQKSAPTVATGWTLEGDIGAAAADWPLAQAAYRTALAKAPDAAAAVRLHGAYRAGGDAAGAEALAAEWLRGHPKDSNFLFHLASVRIVDKQYDKAEAELRRLLDVDPRGDVALNNLAWVLATQKKPGAVETARKAIALAPNRSAYFDTLGLALAAEGKLKEAIEAQQQALALSPSAHDFRLGLARYYVQSGDKAAAGRELGTLAALGERFPNQDEVKSLQAKL